MNYSNIETMILNLKKINVNKLQLDADQVSDASFVKLMEQGYGLICVGKASRKVIIVSW